MSSKSSTTSVTVSKRVAFFEKTYNDNVVDLRTIVSKVSNKSDSKKYNFVEGLQRDLHHTRAALRACCSCISSRNDSCKSGSNTIQQEEDEEDVSTTTTMTTFRALFEYTDGTIANLNRVLQNLKSGNEICFEPECFLYGVNDNEPIVLLDLFWSQPYSVSRSNVFRKHRHQNRQQDDDDDDFLDWDRRRGRCLEKEVQALLRQRNHCARCNEYVHANDRVIIRANLYHASCLQFYRCACCGANLVKKSLRRGGRKQSPECIAFDGSVLCGTDCIRRYDAAHLRQERN